MYIDTHVHFWRLDRGDYGWLKPESGILFRDYLPEELEPLLADAKVYGVIAVQAAATVAETEYMLALSDRHAYIRGVVGWIDVFADSFGETYRQLRRHPRFKGVRLDRSVFERCRAEGGIPDALAVALRAFAADGFAVDLLIWPEYMPIVATWLQRFPELRMAINHLGIPPIRDGAMQPWSDSIDELAQYSGVVCKWSGMITQAGGFAPDLLRPFIAHTADRFGPARIMYGSDWPVALLAGGYADVVRLFETLLPEHWDDAQRAQVRVGNAAAFYGVGG